MPKKGTIDVVLILRRLHEKYFAKKKKLHVCFVDQKNIFYRVPRKIGDEKETP